MDSRGRRSVIVSDGCALYFAPPVPQRGEIIYCPNHRIKVTVTNAPGVYRSKCRNCSAGRRHGASVGQATLHIGRHLRRYAGHTMELWDGYVVMDVMTSKDQLEFTTSVDSAPPF